MLLKKLQSNTRYNQTKCTNKIKNKDFMNMFSKEIKIGLAAILALAIIYFGAIFLKGLKIFDRSTVYYVEMDNVAGLVESSEVLANGLNVGFIKEIKYNPEKQNLIVEIDVKPEFQIPKETTAFVTSGLLGSPKINLALGANSNGFVQTGDTLYGSAGDDLMSSAADMIPSIKALIPKLDSILTNLNNLSGDPSLAASLHNIEYMTNNLRTTTDQLNAMLGKDMPRLMSKADNVLGNVETLTGSINSIDIAGIADNANKTLDNAQNITNTLNKSLQSKDNSLGLLLNDNAIALHLDSTVINASMLLEDLRNHPKRYVHFSLFGRKEK